MMSKIDLFRDQFLRRLNYVKLDFTRSIMSEINWNARLIGIKGARGIGKTTLILQYIKLHLMENIGETLYISLDSTLFNELTLVDLVQEFEHKGGKYLFIDEIHKYENWSQEIKTIYDDYQNLKIVFTGSSLLEILNARADLSRRAVVYRMQGLSLREYIELESGIQLASYSLEEILENHEEYARDIVAKVRPYQYFNRYLKEGYYPFYREQSDLYFIRLGEVLNMILEIELPILRQVELAYIAKVKQLLMVIAASVPFVPNVSKLSERMNINRGTIQQYLHYLGEIELTFNLFKEANGLSRLQKPNKIYLENTNLMYLLAQENVNEGNLRESFFANQLNYRHTLNYTEKGDFLVDGKYTFEIGGKGKGQKQIKDLPDAFIAANDIEYGFQNKIPLWLFGFLY
jgi:predicted AAA+ superfamily ATPase